MTEPNSPYKTLNDIYSGAALNIGGEARITEFCNAADQHTGPAAAVDGTQVSAAAVQVLQESNAAADCADPGKVDPTADQISESEQERINLAPEMEAKGLIERFRNISSADIGVSRTNQLVAAPLGLSNDKDNIQPYVGRISRLVTE
jgi:hypothetical protein